jgi:hypothetical protein
MSDTRSSKLMSEREGAPRYLHLTVEQARAARAEQARLAVFCADRYMQARAAARHDVMLRWAGEYRRAATRCRGLGERIRGEVSEGAEAGTRGRPDRRRTPSATCPKCWPHRGSGLRPCGPPRQTSPGRLRRRFTS